MRLTGIQLHNFRSIGNVPVVLSPWRKCNILIGQNNCGKSNVIKAIDRIANLNIAQRQPQQGLSDLDLHQRSPQNHFSFILQFESGAPEDEDLEHLAGTKSFTFEFSWEKGQPAPVITDYSLARIQNQRQAYDVLRHLTGSNWDRVLSVEESRREFLSHSSGIFNQHFRSSIPQTCIIPEFRQIRMPPGQAAGYAVAGDIQLPQPGAEYTFDGTDLIGLLATYQNPGDGEYSKKEKFDRIQEFVRRLLHLPRAELDVPRGEKEIMLKNGDLRLPLKSYGTGVHELVILATAILEMEDMENVVCCIEEPEIHLHPTLQRELIEFITTETANQYLLSTHSPTLINAHTHMPTETHDKIQAFHLWLEDGATVGGPVLEDTDSLRALNDLGVTASDILQSNCVLWVEGPSDRVYLKRWIELVDPDLVEGLHYSIMFYGGKLLSHISAERGEVPEELIHILRINQHAVVMMDRDRQKAHAPINETKRRVRKECKSSGGICWVTDGREVENYLTPRVVSAVCEEEVGKRIEISIGRYDKFKDVLSQALEAVRARSLDYSANKVRYARKFAEHFEEEDMTDELRKRVEEVVAQIRLWNR